MVKHIILWKLKETIPPEEKEAVKRDIKVHLESLDGKIPDCWISLSVQIRCRPPMRMSCWIVRWRAERHWLDIKSTRNM